MPPLLIGLSGASSSGKTTIARHLRSILPVSVLILHQDDFYRPEVELPHRAGHLDWDCAAAIDEPAFLAALTYLRAHGCLPPALDSKEDRNSVGPNPIGDETVARLKDEMTKWTEHHRPDLFRTEDGPKYTGPAQVVIVDGFLLFGRSVPKVREAFDLRLMLRARYADAKARRENRTGYVTIEGFWEDPPGYVDDVVWPGFVDEHAFLFKANDVEGEVAENVASELDIRVCPGKGDLQMQDTLQWVLDELKSLLSHST